MILIDTNVLLRTAQPGHSHNAVARDALKWARRLGDVPCIVPQVIYEYWVVATRPVSKNGLGLTVADAESDIEQIVGQFHLFRDERTIFDRWQQIVVQHNVEGKTAHDARLVAAMSRHGVDHLLTFNSRHFQRFPSIVVVHPNDAANLQPR